MTIEIKSIIAAEVAAISEKSSQEKVAIRAGVSGGTISQIINGNWSLISPKMWRKIQAKLNICLDWNTAVTKNFMVLNDLISAAHKSSMTIGVAYSAGAGKSEVYRNYARNYENVIYVECKKTWTTKSYIKALCQAAGIDVDGTIEQLLEEFTDHVLGLEKPIIKIDQADKLKEGPFDIFMDLYNDMDGYCAFVVSGVPALEKRVENGAKRKKTGYAEFYSRIGRKWITLDSLTREDVEKICYANNLFDELTITEIFNTCEDDLRVVKRKVQKYFLMADEKARKSA